MPNYIVTSPDGKRHQITAPAGASQEDVLAYAQKQFSAPVASTPPAASSGDRAFADPRVRAVYGAAGLLTGPAQVGAEIGGFLNRKVVAPALDRLGAPEAAARQRRYATALPNAIDRGLGSLEASKQRGMAARNDGEAGADVAGLAGAVATGGFGVKQALQAPSKVVRLAKTLGTGGFFGATAPMTDDGEVSRLENRVDAGLTGVAAAGLVPPLAKALAGAAAGTGRLMMRAVDRFTEAGPKRIAERTFGQNIPETEAAALANTLRQPTNFPAGFNPNASQVVRGTPEGTLIQSLEPLIAAQSGNRRIVASPSVMFAKRDAEQAAALEAAKQARNVLAEQMRDKALALANSPNGPQVRGQKIRDSLYNIATTPGVRASAVVQKAMASVEQRLAAMTNSRTDIVNADDLYMLRKELGNEIDTAMRDSSSFDKKLAGGLQNDLQDAIDGAIEDALPPGSRGEWKDYLKVYSEKSKQIGDAIKAGEDAYTPGRRTNMAGAEDAAEKIPFPATLSTAGLLTRSLEAMTRKAVGPKVGVEMARILQDPAELARVLETTAPKYGPLRKALSRNFNPAAGSAAGSAQIQE